MCIYIYIYICGIYIWQCNDSVLMDSEEYVNKWFINFSFTKLCDEILRDVRN
jgi:hypothetical protein